MAIIKGTIWDVAKNQPLHFPLSESQKKYRQQLDYPGKELGERPCVRLKNDYSRKCIVVDGQYSFNVDIPADSESSICLGYAYDQHSSGGIRDVFRCGQLPRDSVWTMGMIPIPAQTIESVSQTYDFMVESNVMDYNQEVLSFEYIPKPYSDPEHNNVTIKITMRIVDNMAPELVTVSMWIPKEFIAGDDDGIMYGAASPARVSPEMEGYKQTYYVGWRQRRRLLPLLDAPDNIYTFDWTGKFYRKVIRTYIKLGEGTYPVWCGVKRALCQKTNDTYTCPTRWDSENVIVYRPEYVGDLIISPVGEGVPFSYSNVQCEGVETT